MPYASKYAKKIFLLKTVKYSKDNVLLKMKVIINSQHISYILKSRKKTFK